MLSWSSRAADWASFLNRSRVSSSELIPKGEEIGEDKSQIRSPESVFVQVIEGFDPKTHFIFFLVRPGSYEIYREVRKIIWKHDFEIGWEPLTSGKFVSFGTRGRKPKID